MAKLPGAKKLNELLQQLKTYTEQFEEELTDKENWLEGKSDRYQDGEKGQEWWAYLGDARVLVDAINELELLNNE